MYPPPAPELGHAHPRAYAEEGEQLRRMPAGIERAVGLGPVRRGHERAGRLHPVRTEVRCVMAAGLEGHQHARRQGRVRRMRGP